MARASSDGPVTLSLLDRLTDAEEWPTTRAQSLAALRRSLKRDLEWLLNTRKPPLRSIDRYPLARATMVNYGLADLTALGLSSAADQARLRQALEQCLRQFEPRLTRVSVTLESVLQTERRLRFHIEGVMRLEAAAEEVAFDTVLDLSSGEYKVN